jgi:hypothetical protein
MLAENAARNAAISCAQRRGSRSIRGTRPAKNSSDHDARQPGNRGRRLRNKIMTAIMPRGTGTITREIFVFNYYARPHLETMTRENPACNYTEKNQDDYAKNLCLQL